MTLENAPIEELDAVVIRFAGDSGDGMQTVGERLSDSSALAGNDIATFPDFPAEIRAPAGTIPGVSGYQINFGSTTIRTPGDSPDALVAMNPAALKANLGDLDPKGVLVVNVDAFTKSNLKKAGYTENPLDDETLHENYRVIALSITEMTKEALADVDITPADRAKCKNFFALGFIYWIYDRPLQMTLDWIAAKWAKKPLVVEANSKAIKAGYYLGETSELSISRYKVAPAKVEKGLYRKISGNEALVLGVVAASKQAGRDIVLGSYPITPSSSVLEGLSKFKNFGVKSVQAEDEIAAMGVAFGASYTGSIGVTTTSGPGICLKSEFIGLANIAELPLLILNIQRGGPSTGLPTKTEQSDLLQAMYGRNGESPLPVLAASGPGDCFYTAIEAMRIALTYRTPVMLLSDGYIANGAEPWQVPDVADLPDLRVEEAKAGEEYVIYKRDPETLARSLAFPGTPGLEHRIGGLEKDETGSVSYDPENHQAMTDLRQAKVDGIANSLPPTHVTGKQSGKVLVLGWGGTWGAITAAVEKLLGEGESVGSVHLRHLNPLPKDLSEILGRFDKVLIPELNMGQLAMMIRAKYLVDAEKYNKVQGLPFTVAELVEKIKSML